MLSLVGTATGDAVMTPHSNYKLGTWRRFALVNTISHPFFMIGFAHAQQQMSKSYGRLRRHRQDSRFYINSQLSVWDTPFHFNLHLVKSTDTYQPRVVWQNKVVFEYFKLTVWVLPTVSIKCGWQCHRGVETLIARFMQAAAQREKSISLLESDNIIIGGLRVPVS